ncbi:MAG: DNA-directed RNA polymerase [Euryarchaeota archaeon]|nr:DNA-directed RNA polymerase [Euryarchaeota archaeon]
MYRIVEMTDTVRIPPDKMGGEMKKVLEELVHESFEGRMTKTHGITVLTTDVEPLDEGTIIHGDGAIYQRVKFNALVFRPDVQEIVHGIVCEVVEFGCFVHIGPLDALVHMSQIMNDYVSVDLVNERLTGKETKRALEVGDDVRARIVTASLNELSPRESKIGLTMRQPALGKEEWLEEDRKRRREGKTEAPEEAAA